MRAYIFPALLNIVQSYTLILIHLLIFIYYLFTSLKLVIFNILRLSADGEGLFLIAIDNHCL